MAAKKGSGRKSIPTAERLKLWVRAGGRCQICNRYLLEGQLVSRELTFGEAAHIIGQQASEKSARGLAEDLTPKERDSADNLMLVCDDEHDELDKSGSQDAFTPSFLRSMKQKHEDRVHLATSFGDDDRTTPLRVIGWLRAKPVEVNRDAVAAAVMSGAGRMPRFDLSTRNSIEVDLRGIPGEAEPTAGYYRAATAAIDRVLDNKVAEAVASEDIAHLSVFAFARLPLLVYLGSKLDDAVPVDVYQRHRVTEDWCWPAQDGDAEFTVRLSDRDPASDSAVLVVNVSGTIQHSELPDEVRTLPIFEVTLDAVPHPDILTGPQALTSFGTACRKFLAEIENHGHKHIRLLHVFAAMPLSAAVVFGRVFAPETHPALQLYDRTEAGYVPALRVGTSETHQVL
ncbi:UNVERIFIED_ORG: hypothetical protein ABIB21_002092 [Arthrobacter sp. UYEF13]